MTSITNADRRFFWKWMLIALGLHLVAAFFSIGHQAADEYFQILEFMNFKLGKTPVADLAVEYAERMRPWFQPALYFVFAKIWSALGVLNPFTWVFSFRVFAGLVGWASGALLTWQALTWFKTEATRRLLVLLSAFLWFLPVLHVRPSSEGLGGSFFFLGLALAFWPGRRAWVAPLSGILMGLGFESRFQIGVMIAAFGGWWVLFSAGSLRQRLTWLAGWSGGLLLVIALGRVVDFWGYGEWACSPWNYINYNLVRGEVNRYGPSPWWDVLRMSATEAWPILGTLTLLMCVVAWFRFPKNSVTWSTASLFFIHSVISHKELRFFFPIAHAAPLLMMLALTTREGTFLPIFDRFRAARFGRGVLGFLIFLNLSALVVLLFMPVARNVQFYDDYYHWMKKDTNTRAEVLTFGKDPFEVLGTNTYFYKPEEFVLTKVDHWADVEGRIKRDEKPAYLFLLQAELPQTAPSFIHDSCRPLIRTLPSWLFKLTWLNYGDWMSRVRAWTLFECKDHE
ncbi:MAG: hypothetical protein A2X94_05250 [Bdellovibrionales bacterium GWB1_55_8]|nr:MAG: hypothetical protein A2X94_05250 [Bdellovibrionales bacterium GWB1_55_8]